MGISIDAVKVRTYERNVRHIAQQGVTRLEPYVMSRSVQSEAHAWEKMGKNEVVLKSSRAAANILPANTNNRSKLTPDDNTLWERRLSRPQTYNIGDVTDLEDITQMIVDPNSNYAQAHGFAMRRQKDRTIIAAATSDTAEDGDGNDITLPASQTIGSDSTAFSFDLVTQATEIFMSHDIDPDTPKVFVVSPSVARKLLQLTEATSGDYNAVRPLTSKAYIESWMGFTWVVSTLLPTPDAGTSHYCFVMTNKAVGLQINRDIMAKIEQDPSISWSWRIYCEAQFGAVRVEDEQLVRVQVAGAPNGI